MDVNTHLEDLSNEIFFEIFDYLHIFDIFTGFTLLNTRISSILQSIPLHIIISQGHCRSQIDFLSSHLTFHEHQVISLNISDTIRDGSSIISLLFNRHNFINLKLCQFMLINSKTRLDNVIKQIKSLPTLVTFKIFQPVHQGLNDTDKLTRTILTHKSSSLRSVSLQYPNHYLDISSYTSIGSNLTLLNLRITDSPATESVHSVLRIFRLCQKIRYLYIILQHDKPFEDNNISISSDLPSMNENDYPILSQLVTFELTIIVICDIQSISYILRCMPNLKHLYFHLIVPTSLWPFTDQYLDGYVWQNMFELYLPCLSKFEFHMAVMKRSPELDLDLVVNSFSYFVKKYPSWDMVIDRWRYGARFFEEYIILRTMNYPKRERIGKLRVPFLVCGTFETRSTRKTTNDHYSFYSDITNLKLYISNERSNVTCSSPLFQHITYLIVELPRIQTWWNNLFNIVNFRQTIDDNNDAQQNIIYLSRFVHLPNVKILEFQSSVHVDRWKHIQFILQACPSVIKLIINTPLLLSSKLIHNSSLTRIFKQIKMIKSITEKVYFPSNFASKFVQRFPSLSHIELHVFSFDNCVFIIDRFLTRLEHLTYLKIYYNQDTLLDDPFSREYIITKRRQEFPSNIINEQKINVKNNGEVIEIWLSWVDVCD